MKKGAKVYITGRTLEPLKKTSSLGSLRQTADQVEARGGKCVPVRCDHSQGEEVKGLFEQVQNENDGQLDILVNNAWSAADNIFDNFGMPFWEMPISAWDDNNTAGLRNNYICAVYAARMMTKRNSGLIVNISSYGGIHAAFSFNVPYGVGKEACDRMTADCARELEGSNVAFVSLYPSQVKTEFVTQLLKEPGKGTDKDVNERRKKGRDIIAGITTHETIEYSGQCIIGLATDKNIMKKTGKIYTTYDLGREYGLTDKEGFGPNDVRSVKRLLLWGGYKRIAPYTPAFLRIPKWALSLAGNKFG